MCVCVGGDAEGRRPGLALLLVFASGVVVVVVVVVTCSCCLFFVRCFTATRIIQAWQILPLIRDAWSVLITFYRLGFELTADTEFAEFVESGMLSLPSASFSCCFSFLL